jgi:hypothetical protein
MLNGKGVRRMTKEEERIMVEAKQTWNDIFTIITEFPEKEKTEVMNFASMLRILIKTHGQAGMLALALVGAEFAMDKPEKEIF